MFSEKWHLRFLEEAKLKSTYSKDPSTKVGAVIVDPYMKKVIGSGYNGLPRRLEDKASVLNNRDEKYNKIVHGEINAFINAGQDIDGCVLYTWPFLCCSRCASIMIQCGIIEVVAPLCPIIRWLENIEMSKDMFLEAGVTVRELMPDGSFRVSSSTKF